MYYQVVIILTQLTYLLLLQHILNNKTQEPYDLDRTEYYYQQVG